MRKLPKIIMLIFATSLSLISCGSKKEKASTPSIEDSGLESPVEDESSGDDESQGGSTPTPVDNRKDVKLSFYDGNTLLEEIKGKEGDLYQVPNKPSKDGYVFLGWAYGDSLVKSSLPLAPSFHRMFSHLHFQPIHLM